jgi:hypothetical protein
MCSSHTAPTRSPDRRPGLVERQRQIDGRRLPDVEFGCAPCSATWVPRLDSAEMDGTPSWMKTIFVGGTKSLRIRYQLIPSA